jgi:hypothetical protein
MTKLSGRSAPTDSSSSCGPMEQFETAITESRFWRNEALTPRRFGMLPKSLRKNPSVHLINMIKNSEALHVLLMQATVMSRDGYTEQPEEFRRALVVRFFWNEICHQVANVLCGSNMSVKAILEYGDEMAKRSRISNWAFVRNKVEAELAKHSE